jgi:hypothetical protein
VTQPRDGRVHLLAHVATLLARVRPLAALDSRGPSRSSLGGRASSAREGGPARNGAERTRHETRPGARPRGCGGASSVEKLGRSPAAPKDGSNGRMKPTAGLRRQRGAVARHIAVFNGFPCSRVSTRRAEAPRLQYATIWPRGRKPPIWRPREWRHREGPVPITGPKIAPPPYSLMPSKASSLLRSNR